MVIQRQPERTRRQERTDGEQRGVKQVLARVKLGGRVLLLEVLKQAVRAAKVWDPARARDAGA